MELSSMFVLRRSYKSSADLKELPEEQSIYADPLWKYIGKIYD